VSTGSELALLKAVSTGSELGFIVGGYDEGQTVVIEIILPDSTGDVADEYGESCRKCGRPDNDRFTVENPSIAERQLIILTRLKKRRMSVWRWSEIDVTM
jgi:hypothetical protein